eukprot:6190737-Pleurochrysis_carterae.AAC.3
MERVYGDHQSWRSDTVPRLPFRQASFARAGDQFCSGAEPRMGSICAYTHIYMSKYTRQP